MARRQWRKGGGEKRERGEFHRHAIGGAQIASRREIESTSIRGRRSEENVDVLSGLSAKNLSVGTKLRNFVINNGHCYMVNDTVATDNGPFSSLTDISNRCYGTFQKNTQLFLYLEMSGAGARNKTGEALDRVRKIFGITSYYDG
jgi:hypothetical protein